MMRIKKNDKVKIIAGKDKGKEGVVLAILPKKDKVKIKGVSIVTRHVKARRQGETSGIRKEESFIYAPNVMPICSSCKKTCRVGSKQLEDGKRARICSRCKEII
ncbi:MAG: large subunit ribosomal protein L24 [Alteromonas naphthalenivorans]|jgi:large subunit ribosomal protein L24